jgi:hypothetical protein
MHPSIRRCQKEKPHLLHLSSDREQDIDGDPGSDEAAALDKISSVGRLSWRGRGGVGWACGRSVATNDAGGNRGDRASGGGALSD